ncbi:MAG: transcriptional regulator FtsR [Candidatus Geothermincolia bacterium]
MGSTEVKELISIGELLKLLKPEFPELSISKIRFLESEGLVQPQRTPSGYRKFSTEDVQRLRFVLRLQEDKYLPLKVIKAKLKDLDSGRVKASDLAPGRVGESLVGIAGIGEVTLRKRDVPQVLEITAAQLEKLEEHGLVCTHEDEEGEYYEREDVQVLRLAKEFARHGIEPRHLRMYENFAEREASFFEQVILPGLKQKDQEAKRSAIDDLVQLANLSEQLKNTLLRNRLKVFMKQANYFPPF